MNSLRPTDADLVLKSLEGDRASFDELVQRYRGVTYALAVRRLGDRDASADVAQEALVEAYSSLPSLRDPARFAAWLRSITLNLCADRHARLDRGDRVARQAAEQGDPVDPQRLAEREEVRRIVRAAVNGLSGANRVAVNLCYFDGLSCREVAKFCSVSTSAVKSRLHEARKVLRGEKRMSARENPEVRSRPSSPCWMTYSGESYVDPLFWQRPHAKELYIALYPETGRDDRAFWGQWEHVDGLDGMLRWWEYAGVLRAEEGKLIGLVPVYDPVDHEVLTEWHARTSEAVAARIRAKDPEVEDLAREFQGATDDRDNVRHIAVVGRLLNEGVQAVLREGFMGGAHDWGGIGRAYIWGDRGKAVPCTIGYSINSRSAPGIHFKSFQSNMGYPGYATLSDPGSDCVLGLLRRLAGSPQPKPEVVATLLEERLAEDRAEALLEALARAAWMHEAEGCLQLRLPWLAWSVQEDISRMAELALHVTEPIADGADELRLLASQCSFAHCRFTDVAYMLATKMTAYVLRNLRESGYVLEYPSPIPPGWGAWLYIPEE